MKKAQFIQSFLVLIAIALTGCIKNFEQDPFKSQEDAIKNGTDPSNKPVIQEPMSTSAVGIEVPDNIIFREGVPSKIDMRVKSFLPGYTYSYGIENLNDFPDAKLDLTANQFTWTPRQGTVTSGEFYQRFEMIVVITAVPLDTSKPTLRARDVLLVHVENQIEKPLIKSVTTPNLTLEEGLTYYATLRVYDPDSSAANKPTLYLQGDSKLKSIAGFVSQSGNPVYNAVTKEWEFALMVDLRGVEITSGQDTVPLIINYINFLGQAAAVPYRVNYVVQTKFGAPRSNFDNNVQFPVGQTSTVSFLIYDSSNESFVRMTNVVSAPLGAQVVCQNEARPFQQCSLSWAPTAATGFFANEQVVIEVETRSSNPLNTKTTKTQISFNFKAVN